MVETQKRKEPEGGPEADRETELREREAAQDELAHKLPAKTDPAQERGERIAHGKAIATGGKSGHSPPPDRPDEGTE